MRPGKPYLFTALRNGEGVDEIVAHLARIGGLELDLPETVATTAPAGAA